MVEAGLAKETKALLSVPLIPISLFLPVLVTKWTAGHRPMGLYSKTFAVGLIVSGVIGVMVWVTGAVKDSSGTFPGWYIPLLLVIECAYKVNYTEKMSINENLQIGSVSIQQICTTTITVSTMAFSAKISDPKHGATFMTLYNTISNLGTMWPIAVALWLVDPLTITEPCITDATTVCDKATIKIFDGYYVETIACILIGFGWFYWGSKTINNLQKRPEADWRIKKQDI